MKNKSMIISVIILLVVIAIALAIWYFYFRNPSETFVPVVTPPLQQPAQAGNALTPGDTTADIAKDLNQAPDETAATNELNSLDQSLQSF